MSLFSAVLHQTVQDTDPYVDGILISSTLLWPAAAENFWNIESNREMLGIYHKERCK